jgi:RND family efflux transporter MFP subunit
MRRAALILFLFLLAAGQACQRRAPSGTLTPPLVRAHRVAAASDATLELAGTFTAAQRVRLGFKQGGLIASIDVGQGDRVARGQVVARLDDADARAAVRAAQAARDKAQRDADRAARLAAQGALPSSVRDDAQSQLEAADARLSQTRDALERTHLASPVAGAVFLRLAEPGETVGSGTPILVIDSSGHLVARAGATERELALIGPNVPATLILGDGASLPGRVTSRAATPNSDDGLYAVEVTPKAPARAAILAGAPVTLRVSGTQPVDALRIPLDALVHRSDRDFVFVLEASGAGVVARLRPITVGRVEGTTVAARGGLVAGERIVAEGAYFLQDGQAVRVLE